jgi:hypothetical protein
VYWAALCEVIDSSIEETMQLVEYFLQWKDYMQIHAEALNGLNTRAEASRYGL